MRGGSQWVAGADGCRGGWIVVLRRIDRADEAAARLVPTFAGILDLEPRPDIIAVDIPIGLPAQGGPGGRACDVAARANLGGRQSAVFAVPSRPAVLCEDYGEACRAALATSQPPRKVSKQTFNLFPKIREVDRLMTPQMQNRVFEVHPEVAFWALNAQIPLNEPKKLKSRPHGPGLELRRALLISAGYRRDFLEARLAPAAVAGPDDLLDAAVNAWSAVRILRGEGMCFPASPPVDARGLRMEIRA